jgi:hypothetical protein
MLKAMNKTLTVVDRNARKGDRKSRKDSKRAALNNPTVREEREKERRENEKDRRKRQREEDAKHETFRGEMDVILKSFQKQVEARKAVLDKEKKVETDAAAEKQAVIDAEKKAKQDAIRKERKEAAGEQEADADADLEMDSAKVEAESDDLATPMKLEGAAQIAPESSSKKKVPDLRKELSLRGLDTKGLKSELVARLDEAIAADSVEATSSTRKRSKSTIDEEEEPEPEAEAEDEGRGEKRTAEKAGFDDNDDEPAERGRDTKDVEEGDAEEGKEVKKEKKDAFGRLIDPEVLAEIAEAAAEPVVPEEPVRLLNQEETLYLFRVVIRTIQSEGMRSCPVRAPLLSTSALCLLFSISRFSSCRYFTPTYSTPP